MEGRGQDVAHLFGVKPNLFRERIATSVGVLFFGLGMTYLAKGDGVSAVVNSIFCTGSLFFSTIYSASPQRRSRYFLAAFWTLMATLVLLVDVALKNLHQLLKEDLQSPSPSFS